MPKRLELNDVIKIIESTGLKYVNGNYCNHDSKLNERSSLRWI